MPYTSVFTKNKVNGHYSGDWLWSNLNESKYVKLNMLKNDCCPWSCIQADLNVHTVCDTVCLSIAFSLWSFYDASAVLELGPHWILSFFIRRWSTCRFIMAIAIINHLSLGALTVRLDRCSSAMEYLAQRFNLPYRNKRGWCWRRREERVYLSREKGRVC